MALNTSQAEIIDARRRKVAALRLRGITQREIVAALQAQGETWSLGTINHDIDALKAEWRAERLQDTAEKQAEVLAEIREARRAAWGAKDLGAVYQGLKQERELLGLDAPIKQAFTDPSGEHEATFIAGLLDNPRARGLADHLLAAIAGESGRVSVDVDWWEVSAGQTSAPVEPAADRP